MCDMSSLMRDVRVENGSPYCGNYVESGCAPSWDLVGDRHVQCVNGQWSAPLPTCVNSPGKHFLSKFMKIWIYNKYR